MGTGALRRRDRNYAKRAAAAADDFERRGNHDGAGGWQLIEIRQAGQTELARTMHDRVVRERRIDRARLSSIGANRFDTYAEDVALAREQLRGALVEPWTVRTVRCDVQEFVGASTAAPSRSQQHPRPGRD